MQKVNPDYVEALKKIVKESPYPSHMRMVLDHIETDRADVIIELAECHLQPYGIVHGGVVATIIDTRLVMRPLKNTERVLNNAAVERLMEKEASLR